jgi:phage gp29-like protein
VRQDICRADALQFDQTVNRDLVIPYVNFNFGEQAVYPRIKTKLVESKNVQMIVDAVSKLVPLGLKVARTEMLSLLGLGAPADGDEILEPAAVPGGIMELNAAGQRVALNAGVGAPAAEPAEASEPGPVDPAGEEEGFTAITDDIAGVLEKALDKATDFRSFEKELAKLAAEWPADKIARLLAAATFKARVKGMEEFDR